ncbi:MAG: Fur family transcriptional regulator [Bacilli bacterium]
MSRRGDVTWALDVLKEHGYKFTERRKRLLELLHSDSKYQSAMLIASKMKAEYPTMSYETIYRNLATFAELGIAETSDLTGEKHYRFHCPHHAHHHHFICTDCGGTRTIPDCPMDELRAQWEGFQITGHRFEVYGQCPSCSHVK